MIDKNEYFKWVNILLGTVLGIIFSIVGVLVSFHYYINKQIEDKIESEVYVNKLSKKIRPFLIFDDNGNTIQDRGAKEYYIEKIDPQWKNKVIIVRTKKYLQFAPLIIFISSLQYSYNPTRVDDNTWSYQLEDENFVVMGERVGGPPEHNKYLLEVLL